MATRQTVCVDLDGVLAFYDGWKGADVFGDPIPGAVEFIADLNRFAEVVIFTTRCNLSVGGRERGETVQSLQARVKGWLDKHGFKYRDVYVGQGKPLAAAYVDDRSVVCRPQEMGSTSGVAFVMASRAVKLLCEQAK